MHLLTVTLKNVPTNVASVALFSGHFYLIVNFKVTIRKNMPLYNLKRSFNINLSIEVQLKHVQ